MNAVAASKADLVSQSPVVSSPTVTGCDGVESRTWNRSEKAEDIN